MIDEQCLNLMSQEEREAAAQMMTAIKAMRPKA
jgi:hypothetical protein